MNQKGIAHLLLIILAVFGIAVGLYLVKNPQIFSPHADQTPVTKTKSAIESEYNPFGDFWASKRQPEPSMVQNALTTGCYRTGSKNTQTAPSGEEIAFWSKSNAGFVFEECVVFMEDDRTKQYFKNLSDGLAPSGVKYVGYNVLLQADINQTGVSGFYNGTGPVPGYEDFFLYNQDGSVAKQSGVFPILNMTSGRYRAYIIPKMVDYMKRTGMGGVLIDSVYPKENLRSRGTIDLDTVHQYGDSQTNLQNWNAFFIDFLRDLNVAMDQDGQDRLLFTNVDAYDSGFIEGLLPFIDGIMLEDPIGRLDTDFASRSKAIAPVFDKAAELDKYVIVVVNTNINCQKPGDLSCFNEYLPGGLLGGRQKELNEYYLAGYLNLMRNKKTVFMYYTPTSNGPQFNSEAFFKNWDLRIGDPTEPSTEISPGVFLRKFQNAYVFFNNSTKDYQLSGGVDLFSGDGQEITNAVIPAKSGRIFMTRTLLNELNNN